MRVTSVGWRPRVAASAAFAVLLTVGGLASGELLEANLHAPGDGLITRDTRTGLDWLDLTETVGLSLNEILGGAGGWLADGWRYADQTQMCELMESFEIAGTPCPQNGFTWSGSGPSVAYFALLGVTETVVTSTETTDRAVGLYGSGSTNEVLARIPGDAPECT